jgi:hypothetical protein
MGFSKGLALSAIVVARVTESGVEAPARLAADKKPGRLAHSAGRAGGSAQEWRPEG